MNWLQVGKVREGLKSNSWMFVPIAIEERNNTAFVDTRLLKEFSVGHNHNFSDCTVLENPQRIHPTYSNFKVHLPYPKRTPF